jgi:hypothetical protein
MGEMISLNLDEFLDQISPSIKWSASTGYYRCVSCGRQMDSSEKLSHWPNHCSLSKDKTVQKLRDEVLSSNFPDEEKPTLQEVGLDWYQNQIKITAGLPIDFKATKSPIDETLYPSTKARQLSNRDIQDLEDLFSGKIICRAKQVYTHDPIIDSIPMNDDPDPDMFSCPDWLKDHNRAIEETHALGLYAESIKKGVCDLPGCFCHELAAMKYEEEKEDELA